MPINYLFIILIMLFTKLNLYAILFLSFNLQCNASNILSKYYTKQLTN